MSYYGMDTDAVQSVGRQIVDLEPEATTAVNGVLNSYVEASGTVHHPVVSAAMTAYHDTHQKGHLTLPELVRSLGTNTALGGKAIVDGNNEASAVQAASLTSQQGLARELDPRL